ncbi:MAG: hypothetical protein N5P05_003783 [Chroococcopsis gigantea SAG 12.99]|nr:hypothetical protein [Chroococcopsis gigantea SAG 12.99]
MYISLPKISESQQQAKMGAFVEYSQGKKRSLVFHQQKYVNSYLMNQAIHF